MLKLQQRVAQLESQLAESIRQHNQEVGVINIVWCDLHCYYNYIQFSDTMFLNKLLLCLNCACC